MISRVLQHDMNYYLEIIAYSMILFVILFQMGYNKYTYQSTNSEISTGSDPVSGENPPNNDEYSIANIGSWEYFGITIMIGLRFIYAVYKIVKYCKADDVVVKDDESLSLSDLD